MFTTFAAPPVALSNRKLRENVAAHRPELIPLFKLYHKAENSQQQPWEMESPVNAVKLSTFLHSKMLLSPELNRNSPCYIARRIIQLYIKLKYIATFPPNEIDEYGSLGDQEYDEVRMVRFLLHNGQPASDTEHIYRLASMLGISYHGDLWADVMKFVTCALPFAEHTESLLVRGSDDRSILDPTTKTNKYNTSTIPSVQASQAWISRASCTSSSISLDQFAVCEALRQELLLASLSINNDNIRDIFDRKMHHVRLRLANCLGLRARFDDHEFQAIISPSGTDAELLATSCALARLEAVQSDARTTPGTVTSIVTAQGEIGRGSVAASSGQHFSKLTPSGEGVEVGTSLCAFPSCRVKCIQVLARNEDGSVVDTDTTASQAVTNALTANPNNVALLHVVMGSKTGLSCPSLNAVQALTSMYGTRLVVVIDACQMRLNRGALVDFIQRGYIVLVTGSKFYAGVPFCGSVLIPAQSVYELNVADPSVCFPAGYGDYFTKFDFPPFCMQNVRAALPSRMNVGLLLRWETALVNMEVYASIPPAMVAQISHEYIERTKSMLATHTHVALLDPFDEAAKALKPKPPVSADTGLPIQPLDTIVSFHVVDSSKGFLSVNKLKVVHLLLSKDISVVVAGTNDVALAQKKCLVGQPVSLGKLPYGVIRIALGADMVNRIFQGTQTMSELVLEDAIILRKIELILNHWELLCARFVDIPTASVAMSAATSVDTTRPSPPPMWNFSAKSAHYSSVVRHMVEGGLITIPRTMLYDLDAIDMAFQALVTPFPPHFEHRFAVAACPLSFFLRRAIENDVGLTCTSIEEVHHALRLGCAPHKIVYTAPHKSPRDIADAINAGVEVNADSFDELEIIRAHAQQRFQSNFPECTPRYAGELPRIGLRVHACLHTTAPKWSVGIPLTKRNRAKLVQAFHDNPWITGLAVACCAECPIGVTPMQQLAHGARVVCELAKEIDAAVGEDRVKVLNLGGRGLTANFESDDVSPTLAEFVDVLKNDAPKVLERNNGRTVVTEYGSYVSAKVGWTLHQVDCVRESSSPVDDVEDDEHVLNMVVVQPDDAFFTTVRTPSTTSLSQPPFQHRVSVFKSDGLTSTAKLMTQEVVSFCASNNDSDSVRFRQVSMPQVERGDFLVLHDTGARNNVIGSGAVYGYRKHDDEFKVVLLKPGHTLEQAIQSWS
ncbi:hypothetical protein DYB25_001088 [Aphanomyces astaci]|uniref:Orn/DAP/Arg decarboxylase 2 N-terminal domain-containing protein n=1 Tax=Aphanomyces astaci TaxID=112090 RepID=A0A397ATN9_APHAT|nr:hypothetical protein DYB25_001088 [Aphanomyces astaci]RHY63109.1 hypothetical protein DYB30_000614 [Aphanomyces astaci]RHZ25378.1 hypothetical protein DYB26_000226 [Aphanomyces astaci]